MREEREDIKHLKRIAIRNIEERRRTERMAKWLSERYNEIKNAPEAAPNSFWCDTCLRDYDAFGHKEVRWHKGDVWFAFYRAFCPSGHANVRRITDKLGDPYFFKSRFVKREQSEHADEFLTPSDPRFRQVYPQAWADLKEREAWEVNNRKPMDEL